MMARERAELVLGALAIVAVFLELFVFLPLWR